MRLVHQGLLDYDLRTYDPRPDLAQAWEQPSSTEYIFTLAPGIRWQNRPPVSGRGLTAQDVVYSLNRLRTNEPRFINRSLFAPVDKIEPIDQATVRVTTRQPDAATLSVLGADSMLILAPEVVEKWDKLVSAEQVVGTGAFIMKDAKVNVGGEYICNPDYWKPDLPYLDAVRTPIFDDEQTAYAAFLAGKVDIGRLPGDKTKEYIARQGPSFIPDWYEAEFILLMTPQLEKRPFSDPRVTRALRLLADYDEFITAYAEVYYGHGRLGSIIPAGLQQGWDVPQEEYRKRIFWQKPKDPAIKEALDLLSAAGFSRDIPLRFELATLESAIIRPSGELLHAQFRRNSQGVVQPVNVRPYDTPTRDRIAREGTFEYAIWPLSGPLLEIGITLNFLYRTGGGRNHGRLSDSKLDTMIDKQNMTLNTQERKALVREIVLYMMDSSPVIAAVTLAHLNFVSPKVRGYAPEAALSGQQYQWIWLET